MQNNETLLILGRINGVFGIKGWLKVLSFTRPKENIFNYEALLLGNDGQWQQVEIEASQKRGDRLMLKLAGIDTPEAARLYLGCDLGIEQAQLPDLPEGQYYWHQLIGLTVENLVGQRLGQVTDIRETGANDVLVVGTQNNDKRKILIPLVMDIYVKQVDLDAGLIQVDWEQEA